MQVRNKRNMGEEGGGGEFRVGSTKNYVVTYK